MTPRLDYWRKQLIERNVPRDFVWTDAQVVHLVRDLINEIDNTSILKRLQELADYHEYCDSHYCDVTDAIENFIGHEKKR